MSAVRCRYAVRALTEQNAPRRVFTPHKLGKVTYDGMVDSNNPTSIAVYSDKTVIAFYYSYYG